MGGRAAWWALALGLWLTSCAGAPGETPRPGEQANPLPDASVPPSGQPPAERPSDRVEPTPVEPAPPVPPARFQPGHHLALRDSLALSLPTTFRLRLPLQRGGDRVRVTIRAGDGTLQLLRAFVSTAAHPTPVPLSFGGQPGAMLQASGRTTSAPVPLAVHAGEDLVVSFEAQGALAISRIEHLPGGERRDGRYADHTGALGGVAWRRAVGVATVDVEGPPTLAFVALGDSITEGYTSGTDDLRNAWPHVASGRLGVPVVNAGVSSQGVVGTLDHLDAEVLALEGITDCIVLLGTNDLHSHTPVQLAGGLTELYDRLRPFCRVWGATLLPKERSSTGTLAVQRERRTEVNAWLRGQPPVEGVIDFDAVLRDPGAPETFLPGMAEDGIHPTGEGYRVMGEEVARFLKGRPLRVP
jgi:lysophospholipase L1-like esterase